MFELENITEGIGELDFFDNIKFLSCMSLTTLPEGLGNLTSLTILNFCHV